MNNPRSPNQQSNLKYKIFDVSKNGYEIKSYADILDKLGKYFYAKRKRDDFPILMRFGREEDLHDTVTIISKCEGFLHSDQPIYHNEDVALPFHFPPGSLFFKDYIDKNFPVSEDLLIIWIYEIAESLSALHELKLFHNSLCPENILLVNEAGELHVRLLGLQSSSVLLPNVSVVPGLNMITTPCSPPEFRGNLFRTSDVWSLGCVLFYSLTKRYPFGDDINSLYKELDQYQANGILPPYNINDLNLEKLILKMLKHDYLERINLTDMLEYPLFNKIRDTSFKSGDIIMRGPNFNKDLRIPGHIYRIGEITDINDDLSTITFPGYEEVVNAKKNVVKDYGHEFPSGNFEHCTYCFIHEGVIPLTSGCLVTRGNDWNMERHGDLDKHGPGIVVAVNPGVDRSFTTVTVQWPCNPRKVRYTYGKTSTGNIMEVAPFYPPIIPGMEVIISDLKSQYTKGIIHSVNKEKTKATILYDDGQLEELSYPVDFTVDDKYSDNSNFSRERLNAICMDRTSTFISQPVNDIKTLITQFYSKTKFQPSPNLEVGMFVKIPVDLFPCLYGKINHIIDDNRQKKIEFDLIIEGQNYVNKKSFSSGNIFKQCSYGDSNHPPVCVGDKVKINDGVRNGTGIVLYLFRIPRDITHDFSKAHQIEVNSWKYIIVSENGRNHCYKYDEILIERVRQSDDVIFHPTLSPVKIDTPNNEDQRPVHGPIPCSCKNVPHDNDNNHYLNFNINNNISHDINIGEYPTAIHQKVTDSSTNSFSTSKPDNLGSDFRHQTNIESKINRVIGSPLSPTNIGSPQVISPHHQPIPDSKVRSNVPPYSPIGNNYFIPASPITYNDINNTPHTPNPETKKTRVDPLQPPYPSVHVDPLYYNNHCGRRK